MLFSARALEFFFLCIEALELGFGGVRQLWQRAESLPYLNDRPYSLALYLLFGPEFFRHLCRHVEFDVEHAGERASESAECGVRNAE